MEGNLSDDENIQLLNAGDGNINMIQLDDGSAAIICSEASQVNTTTITQAQPLPQRVIRKAASAKNSPLNAKKITTTPAGGGKRALPFSSPTKGITQANKAARGSESKPPSSAEDSDGGMSVDPPTIKKKSSCSNDNCQQMKTTMEEVMQRLKKLEMDHTFLAGSFDAYTGNEIEQVQTLTNKFMAMDANVAQQMNEHIRLANQVGENGEKIQVLHHDLQKTQQGVMEVTAKQDTILHQLATMKEQIQSTNIQSRAQPEQDTAHFLGGIHPLREFFNKPDSDPAQIVRDLLVDIHLYCSLDKTYIADGQAHTTGDRRQARAMILIMRSVQHKKEAIIRIKRYLSQYTIKNVTVSDIFPADQMEMVKKLSKSAELKKYS
jgi:hypothetical protein